MGGNQFQKWNAARESAEWEGGRGGSGASVGGGGEIAGSGM